MLPLFTTKARSECLPMNAVILSGAPERAECEESRDYEMQELIKKINRL
jgi:hypothetical protein